MGRGPLLCPGQLGLTGTCRAIPAKYHGPRPHLLLDVSRVLLHEFDEADVVGAEAAEPVQDAGLARVQKRQLLRHLEGETAVTDGRADGLRRVGAGTRRAGGRGGLWPGPYNTWRPSRLLQVKTAPGYPLSASSSSWIILPRSAARAAGRHAGAAGNGGRRGRGAGKMRGHGQWR